MSSLSETAGPIEKLGKRRKEITLSAFVVNVRTNVGAALRGGPLFIRIRPHGKERAAMEGRPTISCN